MADLSGAKLIAYCTHWKCAYMQRCQHKNVDDFKNIHGENPINWTIKCEFCICPCWKTHKDGCRVRINT